MRCGNKVAGTGSFFPWRYGFSGGLEEFPPCQRGPTFASGSATGSKPQGPGVQIPARVWFVPVQIFNGQERHLHTFTARMAAR